MRWLHGFLGRPPIALQNPICHISTHLEHMLIMFGLSTFTSNEHQIDGMVLLKERINRTGSTAFRLLQQQAV
jgi:hypothetical protein